MKKFLYFSIVIATLFAASCTNDKAAHQEKIKPVKVLEVAEENSPTLLSYTGVAVPREVKKIGFKSPGKILKINVEKGDYVEKGQVLAQIDTTDLEYALRASKASYEAARAQYNKALKGASQSDIANAELNVKKAQDAYEFINNTYEKMKILYEVGAVSKSDLDKTKLELDLRTSDLNQAKEISSQVKSGARSEDKEALLNQVKAAQVDVEYKQNMADEALMKSDVDGYVVDILNKEGEMVAAGYPVLVIRGEGMVVNVGVSQNDITKIKPGTKANIIDGDIKTAGEVTNVSQVPDNQTRAYIVEVALKNKSFAIGSITKVQIIIGEDMGIWIPITSVISSTQDYVYIVRDGVAQKTKVSIEDLKGSMVKVSGINSGDKLIVEGMHKVKDRDKVAIQE